MESKTESDGTRVVRIPLADMMRLDLLIPASTAGQYLRIDEAMAAIAWREAGFPGHFTEFALATMTDRELVFFFPQK